MTAISLAEDRQEQPWPGLAPYGPEDASSFFGREEELAVLSQLISDSVQVTVFGPSGTGKTSLLRAGVLPRLAERDFLAVYIRLDHSPSAPAYSAQIRQFLKAAADANGIEVAPSSGPAAPDHEETLWEYLHRCEFWSARNRLVRPVLVFDQFEEIFTLGRGAANAEDLIAQLGDLCSNAVPLSVETRLAQSGQRLGYPIDSQNYRLVLCLREDFLARLEEIATSVPALRRNRFGIRPMTGLQALAAVLGPGGKLLDDRVARQIVATVGGSRRDDSQPPDDEELRRLCVEPALLSLFCRELNTRRLAHGESRITLEQVSVSGSDILQAFYAEAMSGVVPQTQAFVEDRLLTTSGFRSAVAVEDIEALGVSLAEIQFLVDQRILRFDERQGVRWVEFTHDILTRVASDSRRRRLQHERESAIRQHGRRRTRQAVLFAVGATLIVAAVFGRWRWEYHRNRQELASYYNTWVQRYGLPEGVGELTADQMRHRSVSYKLIRYGSENPVTKMVAVDSYGNPTPNNQVRSFLREGGDDASSARECQWEFILDSSGKLPVYEKASDRWGNMVWGLIYSPVRDGNKVKASFVGPDGLPQPRAQNGSAAEYVEFEYDSPDGFERQRTYMDRRGEPMPGPDRAYGQLEKHDSRGLVTSLASLGKPDGSGIPHKIVDDKGNCEVSDQFDAMGNVVEFRGLDDRNKPTFWRDGTAGGRYERDQYCRITRLQNFDVNGRLCPDTSGVTEYHYTYDEHGNESGRTFFDANGKPCPSAGGYFGWRAEYDDRGNQIGFTCLGSEGKPCAGKNGYAFVRMDYDQKGNHIRWSYFDLENKPVLDQSIGVHTITQTVDARGRFTEKRYFGVDDKPVNENDGYAVVRVKYDEQGNRTEWACFDAQDRPTLDKTDGTHRLVQAYDEHGKVTDESYFGVDDKPFTHKDGYAVVRLTYDKRGNPTERLCLDAHGKPTVDGNTGAYVSRSVFNERGNLIQTTFFGLDETPSAHLEGYATVRMNYDERGHQIEWACFDTQGARTVDKSSGVHRITRTYDAWGRILEARYFDADGKPVAQKNEYAILRMKYDDRGNQTEWVCFDVHDRPAVDKSEGAHKAVTVYDSRGKVVENRYFDVEDKPTARKDGYSIVRIKYDDRGYQTEWACFDTRDRPAVDKSDGTHKALKAYDERGEVIEERYVGVDRKPVANADGIAIKRFTYDAQGNRTLSAYFDTQGLRTVHRTLGVHQVAQVYDEHGAIKEIRYLGLEGNLFARQDNGYAIDRTKHDDRGNLIEWACFDAHDRPTVDTSNGMHKTVKVYDERGKVIEERYFGVDEKPFANTDGYAVIRMKYDEKGNRIMWACFDTQDQPTLDKATGAHRIDRVYDELGRVAEEKRKGINDEFLPFKDGYAYARKKYDNRDRVVEMRYFGADGEPFIVKGGYAIVRVKQDDNGNLLDWACFDAQERPVVDLTDETHRTVMVYNQRGKIIEERYFGVDEKPFTKKNGCAVVRMKYDEKGNETDRACFDAHDRPTVDLSDGTHRTLKAYDERGNVIEARYFGVDGKPVANKDGVAINRYAYDAQGNQTMQSYFDTQGLPSVRQPFGVHQIGQAFDEHGKVSEVRYFGPDGKLFMVKDGYAIVRIKRDDKGNIIDWACFDTEDRPTVDLSDGSHRTLKAYDERGNVLVVAYLGVDDKPTTYKNGYAVVRMKYDEKNNQTVWSCFDIHHRPTLDNVTSAQRIERTYDEQGMVTAEKRFGVNGEFLTSKEGYAYIRKKYDERGRIVAEEYVGVDGEPFTVKNGYAMTHIKQDDNGNLIDWACFDAQERPVVDLSDGTHRTVRLYNQGGKLIEERYVGVDERPGICMYGYSIVRMEYDEKGNRRLWAYFDSEGSPTLDKSLKVHLIAQAYDEGGHSIATRYFGLDDKPCAQKDGYAIVRMKNDEKGNWTERACFDTQNRPAIDLSDGTHRIVRTYDAHERIIEERYFGVDEKPFTYKNGFSIVRMEYDKNGNRTVWACFDTELRPAINTSDGTHKTVTVYDERGNIIEERYFGIDGKPLTYRNGYAIVRMKYDAQGNRILWTCFDTEDRPVLERSLGVHKVVELHDDRGATIETRYFGVDQKPIAQKDGYAIVRMKRDDKGNLIDWACFDTNDRPTVDLSNGTHRTVNVYDDRGNTTETRYFDSHEELIRTRCVVTEVLHGTAERIGLKIGDVLWQYEGKDVLELSDLQRQVQLPGTSPRKLVIHRNGRSLEFDVAPGALGVSLNERPESALAPPGVAEGVPAAQQAH